MPLYVCNTRKGLLTDERKGFIAREISRIHSDAEGTPEMFVHSFFLEEDSHFPIGDNQAVLFIQFSAGKSEDQKTEIIQRVGQAFQKYTDIDINNMVANTTETPAGWIMEGGDLLSEKEDDENWIVAYEAKEKRIK